MPPTLSFATRRDQAAAGEHLFNAPVAQRLLTGRARDDPAAERRILIGLQESGQVQITVTAQPALRSGGQVYRHRRSRVAICLSTSCSRFIRSSEMLTTGRSLRPQSLEMTGSPLRCRRHRGRRLRQGRRAAASAWAASSWLVGSATPCRRRTDTAIAGRQQVVESSLLARAQQAGAGRRSEKGPFGQPARRRSASTTCSSVTSARGRSFGPRRSARNARALLLASSETDLHHRPNHSNVAWQPRASGAEVYPAAGTPQAKPAGSGERVPWP